MKHYLSIAAALTVSAMAAFAQTEAGGVLVNHPELLRNERLMTVEMEVSFQDWTSPQTVLPYILR